MEEDGHGEPAIQKFLTEPRCNRQRDIGKQFRVGLRKDPLRKSLNRAPRFDGNSPHAPEVQPLKRPNRRGADNRGDKNLGSVGHRQTKLGGRKSVRPCAPGHNCDGKPSKRNGRSVKGEAIHRADEGQRQQFLHARAAAPRQDHREHKKNEPDVPGQPRIRTLSACAAQVCRSVSRESIWNEVVIFEKRTSGETARLPLSGTCFARPNPVSVARLPALRHWGKLHGPCRILPPLLAAPSLTTAPWKKWAAEEWEWSTKPGTRGWAEVLH